MSGSLCGINQPVLEQLSVKVTYWKGSLRQSMCVMQSIPSCRLLISRQQLPFMNILHCWAYLSLCFASSNSTFNEVNDHSSKWEV